MVKNSAHENELTNKEISSPVAKLVKLAREKGYLTFGDFLAVIPRPEESLAEVDLVFATLHQMDIQLVASEE
jgi:hypothetical protein